MSAVTATATDRSDSMQASPKPLHAQLEDSLPVGRVDFDYGGKRRTFLGNSLDVYRTPADRRPKMTVMVPEKGDSLSSVTVGAADGRGMWIMTGRPDGAVSGIRSLPKAKQGEPFPVGGTAMSVFAAIVTRAVSAGPAAFGCEFHASRASTSPSGGDASGEAREADEEEASAAMPAEEADLPVRDESNLDEPTAVEPITSLRASPPANPVPVKLAILTGNAAKAAEYLRFFGRYGVRPQIVDPVGREPSAVAAELLSDGATVVLREESDIFLSHPGHDGPPSNLDLMDNRSEATTWTLEAGRVVEASFAETVGGYYDAHADVRPETFGWDANFVPLGQVSSLDASALCGEKVSARDLVLSEVVSAHLRFPARTDIAFHPVGTGRVVDFSVMPHEHLAGVHWLATPAFRTSMLSRILGGALSDGVFFRSAETRRERNYWWPGLNGGLPLVAKKDDVHELTFLFHDLMHAAMPDLVFDGNAAPDARRAYIAHRMVGEAISLVLADFLFVDTMVRSGLDYDLGKRRIHPFFSSANDARRDRGLSADEAVREMCRANAIFALTGDDAPLRSLGGDDEALEAYTGKYGRFFAEDLRWTAANFERLSSFPAPLDPADGPSVGSSAVSRSGLTFVTDFVTQVELSAGLSGGELERMPSHALAEAVFTESWDYWFARRLSGSPKFGSEAFDAARAKSNAISRYMLGQSVMYGRFPHVPPVAVMGEALAGELRDAAMDARVLGDGDLARMRRFHGRAVDLLREAGAISPEDARVYREVYPVFPPHFVFYDSKGDERTLAEVAADLLDPPSVAPDEDGASPRLDDPVPEAAPESVAGAEPEAIADRPSGEADGGAAAPVPGGFNLSGFIARRRRAARGRP